jgi:hypothetical protein
MLEPDDEEAVMLPSAAPKQLTFVDEALTVTWIGWLMVTVVEAVQLPSLLPLGALAVTV